MRIKERTVGQVTILDADGRMTRNEGYGVVKKRVGELLAGGHNQLLLNLAAVPYMDSTCVGELVSAFITVRNGGGTLKFMGAMGRLRELLSIAKLDTVFELFDTETTALESFGD